MNNKITKIWRIILAVGLLFTIVASILIAVEINNIPKDYTNNKTVEAAQIKDAITTEFLAGDYTKIDNLLEEYSIEINIRKISDGKTVYASIKDMNVNKSAITYEEKYTLSVEDEKYEVWWLMYNVLPQEVFDANVQKISFAIFVIVCLITVLLAILLFKFLQPLRELKNNINKLSEFKLDEIQARGTVDEYSALNRNIAEFSHDLDVLIKETGYKYTNLESQLQYQNERLSYQNRLVASLTHNLKAPLVTIKYLLLDDVVNKQEIDNKVDLTIEEINDISRVVFQSDNVKIEKEKFDLIELLFNIYDSYKLNFKEKNLFVDFNVDEKLFIYDHKLQYKQLIHNAMSNIVSYAKENAEVEIACYAEGNKLILSFYNDAQQLTQQQLDNVFKLFYRISDSKEGLGTGLFTIKYLASSLQGEIEFGNVKNGVILRFNKTY
ncbi:HAMP domain-containing histidine kinase [Erysipelotrichaceae bacterium OttesenSCG-928-M19]|nr:HAMP domain-containing histidine kinase [Erysipelotrichaceae bacterium OttesenSCG-928-M19]